MPVPLSEPGFLGFEDSHHYFFVSGIITRVASANPKNRDLDIFTQSSYVDLKTVLNSDHKK
jgi:hypothetical protein